MNKNTRPEFEELRLAELTNSFFIRDVLVLVKLKEFLKNLYL